MERNSTSAKENQLFNTFMNWIELNWEKNNNIRKEICNQYAVQIKEIALMARLIL